MWCIPPEEDGAFVARMEQVLQVYSRPRDPRFPVVCMDEQPYQLLSETRACQPVAPGRVRKVDYEQFRQGCCAIWMFVEPLGSWRKAGVSDRGVAKDWAERVRELVDHPRFASAEKITLVCDNPTTHDMGSLYATFPRAEANRVMNRLRLVFTPKHGSWLNIAELELSALTRQALTARLPDLPAVKKQVDAWSLERNRKQTGVRWHFSVDSARVKLNSLYPKIIT